MQRNRLVSDEVPETITATKPSVTAVPTAELPAVAHAVTATAATTVADANAVHGAAAHVSDAHGFDFDALNASHNMPYSAVEWVHGHPALILNAGEYAQVNWARLSSTAQFA